MPKADVSVRFKKTLVRMIAVWSYRCVEIARSSVCTLCTSQNRYRSTCELKNVQALEKICAYSMLDTKLGKKKKKKSHAWTDTQHQLQEDSDRLAGIYIPCKICNKRGCTWNVRAKGTSRQRKKKRRGICKFVTVFRESYQNNTTSK